MAIKKFFFLVFMSLFVHYNAQTYVKVNGFTLPALMLNAGIETKLTDKTTFQADVFVSPWKSVFGNRMLFAIGVNFSFSFLKKISLEVISSSSSSQINLFADSISTFEVLPKFALILASSSFTENGFVI